MPTIADVLREMEQYMIPWRDSLGKLNGLRRSDFTSTEAYEKRKKTVEQERFQLEKDMELLLQSFERHPDRLYRIHSQKLADFDADGNGSYDDFVFIMTKFPDANDPNPEGQQLNAVIKHVKDAISARGYKPRIASEKNYNKWLFGNVELFLFGCARGVAIIEDRYLPELNPNVAIEWGWMTGMGRDVLYLREQKFQHERADWSGLVKDTFDWDNPQPGIDDAVSKFLPKRF